MDSLLAKQFWREGGVKITFLHSYCSITFDVAHKSASRVNCMLYDFFKRFGSGGRNNQSANQRMIHAQQTSVPWKQHIQFTSVKSISYYTTTITVMSSFTLLKSTCPATSTSYSNIATQSECHRISVQGTFIHDNQIYASSCTDSFSSLSRHFYKLIGNTAGI